jgi:nitrogen regulatory protein PII
MKRIEVIIERCKEPEVIRSLQAKGIQEIVTSEVKDFSFSEESVDQVLQRDIAQRAYGERPMLKLEVVVPEREFDMAADVICTAARTNNGSNSRIFCSTVNEVYDIRTGNCLYSQNAAETSTSLRRVSAKIIASTIWPQKTGAVIDILRAVGVQEATVMEIRDFGPSQERCWEFLGWPEEAFLYGNMLYLPKTEIRALMPEKKLHKVIAAMCHTARTGNGDEGSILVLPIEKALDIYTKPDGTKARTHIKKVVTVGASSALKFEEI